MKFSIARTIPLAALAAVLVACGGGGGGGGAGATGGTSTGSSKTTYVTGAISGFGSVIVNGVHYESDSATVTLNGRAGTVAQLKVGEVVHLKAQVDAQGVSHATTIEQDRLIQGLVQAVDTTANTLTVAGQVILVNNETVFDPSVPGGTLAGIAVGSRVEVHGFVDANGNAIATRIDMAAADDSEIEVTGTVVSVDAPNKRLTVGTQVVDYSTATLDGFPTTGPAVGDIVEAEGTTLLGDGALQATRLKKEDGGMDGQAGDGGELEGLVTRFASATDFDVSGQKVTTTSTTVFVGGTASDLNLNVLVEVEGTLDSSGTLVASKVVFRHEATLQISAGVEAVDTTAGTLQVLGVTFTVNNNTRVEDDQMDNQFFSLADVHVGDWVDVSGYPDPANAGKFIATKLERHGAENVVHLDGVADQVAAPSFSIAGIGITTTDTTAFWNGSASVSAADFFAAAAGKHVEVEGTWSGTTPLVATAVRIDAMHD